MMRASTVSSLLVNDSRQCLLLSTFPRAPKDHGSLFPGRHDGVMPCHVVCWGWVNGKEGHLPLESGKDFQSWRLMCTWGLSGRFRYVWFFCGFRKDTRRTFFEVRSCWWGRQAEAEMHRLWVLFGEAVWLPTQQSLWFTGQTWDPGTPRVKCRRERLCVLSVKVPWQRC